MDDVRPAFVLVKRRNSESVTIERDLLSEPIAGSGVGRLRIGSICKALDSVSFWLGYMCGGRAMDNGDTST